MHKAEIFTKPNCHLCEVAIQEINSMKNEHEFALTVIDITKNSELLEKYKEYIPVVLVNNKFVSRYSLNRDMFLKMLNE